MSSSPVPGSLPESSHFINISMGNRRAEKGNSLLKQNRRRAPSSCHRLRDLWEGERAECKEGRGLDTRKSNLESSPRKSMRFETTIGMEAQDKQKSARVSVYEICSPGKAGAFQSTAPKGSAYTCTCALVYVRFYPSPWSFVHLFCGSRRGTKWKDRFEVQRERAEQTNIFCALLKRNQKKIWRHICVIYCSIERE